MRIAMAQMKMSESVTENLTQTVAYMRQAKNSGADIVFFPELQLSPFFPKYERKNAERYLLTLDSKEIKTIRRVCNVLGIWASPNLYLSLGGRRYDASLMINASGEIVGISKMVHIYQAEYFYEQDYYAPSDDGFKVYDTPFGKIGVVICFDRHIPESIRSCAVQGAELIIIPTANLITEDATLFEWEIRVEAFHNLSYIAMCNRVGKEDGVEFCGESLIAAPDGKLLLKSDNKAKLITFDIDLPRVQAERTHRSWLELYGRTGDAPNSQ